MRKITPREWEWREWTLGELRYAGKGPKSQPRPQTIPAWYEVPPLWHFSLKLYLLRRKLNPQPQAPPSLFSHLGGFISQAGSFPPDTESARAFIKAGGKWLAVQFGDPATDQGNRQAFTQGWAERWRLQGVKVGAWWRVEHVGVPVPQTPPVDFLIPNPENAEELDRLPAILTVCRERLPHGPLAVITLGKIPGFPTGLLESLDAHLIPECFLETAEADTTVTNSVRYWLDSKVDRGRIHPCLLHKSGYITPTLAQTQEAKALRVTGLSSFVAETTPATAWSVMA